MEVEIDVVRDRCNHYGGYDQLPSTPVNIDSDLDGSFSGLW